mmetsp:Transcript_90262/g.170149  ORF Transcript_90262/g.170149 Transcript_90262/m.170149 type:complete len:241 (-) Transcript_90262:144-866(-)
MQSQASVATSGALGAHKVGRLAMLELNPHAYAMLHSTAPINGNYQGDYSTSYADVHCVKPQQHLDFEGEDPEAHGHGRWRWPSPRVVTGGTVGLASNLTSMKVAGATVIATPGAAPVVLGKYNALPHAAPLGGRRRTVGGAVLQGGRTKGRTNLQRANQFESRVRRTDMEDQTQADSPTQRLATPRQRPMAEISVPKNGKDYPTGRFSPRSRYHPSKELLPMQPHETILREFEDVKGRWR